jgi:hypothetical protein
MVVDQTNFGLQIPPARLVEARPSIHPGQPFPMMKPVIRGLSLVSPGRQAVNVILVHGLRLSKQEWEQLHMTDFLLRLNPLWTRIIRT